MQELIVALVVAFAAWSIAARYTPMVVKRRVRALAAQALRGAGLPKAANYIGREAKDADCASGCGSCGGCGSAPKQPARQSSVTPEALRRSAQADRH